MLGSFRKRGCKCPPERKRCTCGAKWYYRYDVTDPVTGKRKQKETRGFATRAEAESEAKRILSELESGTYVEEKDISFKAYSDKWFSTYAKSGIKISTLDLRRSKHKMALRYFEHIKLKDMTKMKYQDMLNDLFDRGYARKTIQNVHETVGLIFKSAVDQGIVTTNITLTATVPKKPKTVEDLENKTDLPKYMEKSELIRYLEAAEMYGKSNDYASFYLMAYTGIRPGEAMALKWSDINFEEQTISITKTLYRKANEPGKHAKSDRYVLLTPKTESSERVVDIEDDVIDVLKKHKAWQNIEKMGHRDAYDDQNYVFANHEQKKGGHVSADRFNTRMKRLLKIAGLPSNLSPHAFRHTHISLLAEAGANLDEIMERVGHGDAKITRSIYLHITKTRKREVAQKFSAFMQT